MNGKLELAQLLVSSWLLHGKEQRLPVSHGLMDRALKKAQEVRALPDWASSQLHFAESREGLQCIELQGLLDYAQEAGLTTRPTTSYQYEEVTVSKPTARWLLRQLQVRESEAKKLGELLAVTVNDIKEREQTLERTAEDRRKYGEYRQRNSHEE
jgi:hypothetical protein